MSYTVRTFQDHYTFIELIDTLTDSIVTLCPERGGIATRCRLGGRELFYLNEATLNNPTANIRGGNPILYPICGPLLNGQYEWGGEVYAMKQHGIARTMKWEVVQLSDETAASATLTLRSNSDTRVIYPFDFELTFTYRLHEGELTIEQEYANAGSEPMPMYAGFHPYFQSIDGPIHYKTDGTRLLDCNDGQEKSVTGVFEAHKLVESVIVLNAEQPTITFWPDQDYSVTLTYSPIFRYVVLWSIPGAPFVCVEPWMAQNLELNRGQELQLVAPNDSLRASFTISCNLNGGAI